jgi:hypothetical protein
MADNFLKEQLELLKKLNERVSKIHDEVSHNVEVLARQREDAEHRVREERIYRQRDPGNERRKGNDRSTSDDAAILSKPPHVSRRHRF